MRRAQDRARSARSRKNGARSTTIELRALGRFFHWQLFREFRKIEFLSWSVYTEKNGYLGLISIYSTNIENIHYNKRSNRENYRKLFRRDVCFKRFSLTSNNGTMFVSKSRYIQKSSLQLWRTWVTQRYLS